MNSSHSSGGSFRSSGVQSAISAMATATLLSVSGQE
jgi:hypothetical protein